MIEGIAWRRGSLQEEKCCCDQRFVVLVACMNEQLKCMEMLLMYSLEPCTVTRAQKVTEEWEDSPILKIRY